MFAHYLRGVSPVGILAILILPAVTAPAAAQKPAVDQYGDPLPPGAIARLGTLRFTHETPAELRVALAPDGKMLATLSIPITDVAPASNPFSTLRLWERASGKLLREITFPQHARLVDVKFSPDGKFLAVNRRTLLEVISVHDENAPARWYHGSKDSTIETMQFSADGSKLIGCEKSGHVRVWAMDAPGKPLKTWEPPPAPAKGMKLLPGMAISSDLKLLAHRWESDKKSDPLVLTIRRADSGEIVHQLAGEKYPGEGLTFSPDGKLLAGITWYKNAFSVVLLDTPSGKILHRLATNECRDLVFSPDGKMLASQNYKFSLWDVATGKRLTSIPGWWNMSADFAADGKTLATADYNAAQVWDLDTRKRSPDFSGHRNHFSGLHFSDKDTLVSFNFEQLTRWDTSSWTETSTHWPDQDFFLKPENILIWNTPGWYVAVEGKGTFALRDWTAGKLVQKLQSDQPEFHYAMLSANRKTLALEQRFNVVSSLFCFFDVDTGKQTGQVDGIKGSAEMQALSPDGKWFVYREAGMVILIDTRNGKKSHSLARPKSKGTGEIMDWGLYFSLTFSPDSRLLAAGMNALTPNPNQGKIFVWETATGRHVSTIAVRTTEQDVLRLKRLAFSPDNRLLAYTIGGEGQTIHFAEVVTGAERGRIEMADFVTALAFAPDGKHLAAAAEMNNILIWDLNRPLGGKYPLKATLTPQELEACWDDLADFPTAKKAERAIWALVAAPGDSVPFLRKKLAPVPPPPAAKIKQLIAELDSDKFKVRQEAMTELEKFGELAVPFFEAALKEKKLTLEGHLRVQKLLAATEHYQVTPELVRPLRALEALERMGSAEARQLLQTLAAGAAGARFTAEAKQSLQRLNMSAGK